MTISGRTHRMKRETGFPRPNREEHDTLQKRMWFGEHETPRIIYRKSRGKLCTRHKMPRDKKCSKKN